MFFRPLTPQDVHTMLTWQYPPPYQRYTFHDDDGDAVEFFTNPINGYWGIWEEEHLIGFCCFGEDAQVSGGDYSMDALDVGAGFRPDLIGQGQGAKRLGAILAFGQQQFTPTHFRATIAEFNQRAQRACLALGFTPVQTFMAKAHQDRFVILIRRA